MFVLFWKAQTPHAGKGTGKLLVKKEKITIGKLSCLPSLSRSYLVIRVYKTRIYHYQLYF